MQYRLIDAEKFVARLEPLVPTKVSTDPVEIEQLLRLEQLEYRHARAMFYLQNPGIYSTESEEQLTSQVEQLEQMMDAINVSVKEGASATRLAEARAVDAVAVDGTTPQKA